MIGSDRISDFPTAHVCPLGVDLYCNGPDGSVWMWSLSWDEVAKLARGRGTKLPRLAVEKLAAAVRGLGSG